MADHDETLTESTTLYWLSVERYLLSLCASMPSKRKDWSATMGEAYESMSHGAYSWAMVQVESLASGPRKKMVRANAMPAAAEDNIALMMAQMTGAIASLAVHWCSLRELDIDATESTEGYVAQARKLIVECDEAAAMAAVEMLRVIGRSGIEDFGALLTRDENVNPVIALNLGAMAFAGDIRPSEFEQVRSFAVGSALSPGELVQAVRDLAALEAGE